MGRLLRVVVVLTVTFLLVGAVPDLAAVPHPAQETQSVGAQATAAPLPLDCSAIAGSPSHCAFGYVYYDGDPVAGAQVEITSSYGTLNTATANGSLSSQPYFEADLSGSPLLVSAGDTITVIATYNGSTASVGYEVAPGGQQVDVIIAASPFFGTGVDGDLTIGSGQTSYTDNTRSSLAATASAGQKQMGLSSASGFAAGREVLIIQMQGTGAGNYEFGTIASINGNTLTLLDSLTSTYTVGGNSKAQVILVPHYRNVTVNGGGTLTASDWNSSTGGMLVFRASGSMLIYGTLQMNGRGYDGGVGGDRGTHTGAQGDSYPGPGTYCSTGGCDRNQNNGGGGGCSGTYEIGSGAGGGGGFGSSGTAGWRDAVPGTAYGTADLRTMFPGSGGGGGYQDSYDVAVSNGGNGGGAVFILARAIQLVGTIQAKGDAGQSTESYPGGGGSGGAIKLVAESVSIGTNRAVALGGAGGVNPLGDHGGSGAIGRLRIEYGTLSGTTNPAASTEQLAFPTTPIPTINTVYPAPATQGQDAITFRSSAASPRLGGATITAYVWRSDLDGLLSTQASFTSAASSLSAGTHTIYFKAKDSEDAWSTEVSRILVIKEQPTATPTATSTPTPTPTATTATSMPIPTTTATATPAGRAESASAFLPLILRQPSAPPALLTTLYVNNRTTGLVLHYTVHGTPEGDISCTNIPAGATVLCGSFTPGTYQVSVDTVECGASSGQVTFAAGSVTRIVSCQ